MRVICALALTLMEWLLSPAALGSEVVAIGKVPGLPVIQLMAEPCKDAGWAKVIATHYREGVIKGCWTRERDALFIHWDDEDVTILKYEEAFGKGV